MRVGRNVSVIDNWGCLCGEACVIEWGDARVFYCCECVYFKLLLGIYGVDPKKKKKTQHLW